MEITRDVNGKAKRDNDDTPSLPFNFEKRPIIHFGQSILKILNIKGVKLNKCTLNQWKQLPQ